MKTRLRMIENLFDVFLVSLATDAILTVVIWYMIKSKRRRKKSGGK